MQVSGTDNEVVTKLLIVDDSLVFRRFLVDIFEEVEQFDIVGEAENGIEALDMVLKTNPDVILLDLEMPLMDGMTALQHLMIHKPTPTIMFSSLSEEGTARSFDTMKNGAVDFICKDFIFHKNNLQNHAKILIDKVKKAANLRLKAREPVFTTSTKPLQGDQQSEQRVVFCEECGRREVVRITASQPVPDIVCGNCGDAIEITDGRQTQYRRNNFITVFGGGEGSFFNLLEIIPRFRPEMGGAIIAVIHRSVDHVNSFAEYLDAVSAMKVIRAREGVSIEGGNCYIVSGHDFMSLKPYSAQLTLQKIHRAALKGGPLDILLASVSTIFKKRSSGIVLSGEEHDGDRGMSILMKNGGNPAVLRAEECYCQAMGQRVAARCDLLSATNTTERIIESVRKLHHDAKYNTVE